MTEMPTRRLPRLAAPVAGSLRPVSQAYGVSVRRVKPALDSASGLLGRHAGDLKFNQLALARSKQRATGVEGLQDARVCQLELFPPPGRNQLAHFPPAHTLARPSPSCTGGRTATPPHAAAGRRTGGGSRWFTVCGPRSSDDLW